MKISTDCRELNARSHNYIVDPVFMAQEPLQKSGQKDGKSQTIRECSVYSRNACINKTEAMTISVGMLIWNWGISQGPTPRQRTTVN